MLLARTKKDDGIQRCDPRYKNTVSVNSCFNQIRIFCSVCLHVSQVTDFRMPRLLKNWIRSRAHVTIVHPVLITKLQYETEQIGIRCSGTQKCSQRLEIDHFCLRKISSLETSKNGCESNRGTFRFTISISDILIAPSCRLRSFLEVGVS